MLIQHKLRQDINKIKKSEDLIFPADKTSNFYR